MTHGSTRTPRSPARSRRGAALGAGLLLAAGLAAGAAAAQSAYDGDTRVSGGMMPAGRSPPHLGRAGPPGTFVTNADIQPVCIAALTRAGFMARRVSCAQLATKPGLTTQCVAGDGRHTASAIATFLDYDPVTGRASTDCYLKNVIGKL